MDNSGILNNADITKILDDHSQSHFKSVQSDNISAKEWKESSNSLFNEICEVSYRLTLVDSSGEVSLFEKFDVDGNGGIDEAEL
jgi:hypothetical protein